MEKKVNPREVGLFQYLGFDDWRWSFPIAMIIGTPLLTQEVIYVDYHFYMIGVFGLMWHAYDAVLYPIYAEKSEWVGEYIKDSWIAVDNDAVQEINDDIKVNEEFLQSKQAFEEIFDSGSLSVF